MLKTMIAGALSAGVMLATGPSWADDRELVDLPAPMAAHMMANMRDHLRALEDMLAALAQGDVAAAGAVAEQRLGMSSLDSHGAAHMAPMMPAPMQAIGTAMHRAASRFVTVAQDADVAGNYTAQQEVFAALRDITTQCNACHAAYRIR